MTRSRSSSFLAALAVSLAVVASVPAPAADARIIILPDGTNAADKRVSNRKVKEKEPNEYQAWRLRNMQRKDDIKIIGNAFSRYRSASKDQAPKEVQVNVEIEICRWDAADCTGLLDLQDELSPFIDEMPVDPSSPADGNGTGYAAKKNYKGQVFLRAILAEKGWQIKYQH